MKTLSQDFHVKFADPDSRPQQMPPEMQAPVAPAIRPLMGKPRQFQRVSGWQKVRTPAVIMAAFLLSVWVTLGDIEDARMRTSDQAAGSAEIGNALRPFAGDVMRRLLGLDSRSGFAEGAPSRPRPADEDPQVAP